jgi:hypothetical protein
MSLLLVLEFVFMYLLVLGFELRASCLLYRYSTSWVMPLALFALVILEIGSHFLPWPTWTMILSLYLSFFGYCGVWTQGLILARQVLCLLRHSSRPFLVLGSLDSWASFPGWPQTTILPIFASWVAGITEVSHSLIFLFYAYHYHWDDRCMPPHPAFCHWDIGLV